MTQRLPAIDIATFAITPLFRRRRRFTPADDFTLMPPLCRCHASQMPPDADISLTIITCDDGYAISRRQI
jgi:hypothetical protein